MLRFQQRSLHISLPRLLRNRRKNPGVAYQVHEDILNSEEAEQDDTGSLDADFAALHRTHRQHEEAVQRQREQIKRHIIKHKYFRDPHLPNLLTYAEKEQIRFLNARDPEEWTPETLAECFPATPSIITKLLEAKWRPRTAARITKHDEVVLSNWEKIRSGSNNLQLSQALLEHLQKFSNRRPQDLKALSAEEWSSIRTQLPQPQRKEFLSIITSCSKYADDNREHKDNSSKYLTPPATTEHIERKRADIDSDTYLLEKVKDKRKMRLQELKQFMLTAEELATSSVPANTAHLDYRAATTLPNPSGTGILPPETTDSSSPLSDYAKKFESTEIVVSIEDQQRFEINRAKERVHIPRKLWRKGATYRVEDCYYDDDGELLYRVPGMTGHNG